MKIIRMNQTRSPYDRIIEFEALRGIMAWVVVVNHALDLAGNQKGKMFGRFIMGGGQAVDVFIILSGFVIMLLLDRKQQSPVRFYVGRFFRLWPLLLFAILAGVWVLPLELSNLSYLSGTLHSSDFRIMRINGWLENLPQHFLISLTMTNAIVPDRLLENVDRFAIPPAWSIGLEWSFYLVAPFILGAIRSKSWPLTCVMAGLCIAAAYPWIGIRLNPSCFPVYAPLFGAGIGSFFLYKHLLANPDIITKYRLSLICSLITIGALGSKPLLVWMLVLLAVILDDGSAQGFWGKMRQTLRIKPLVFLGRISYSTYLSHWIVITLVIHFSITRLNYSAQQISTSLLPLIMVLAGTLLTSIAAYYSIEKKGIAVGGRLLRK